MKPTESPKPQPRQRLGAVTGSATQRWRIIGKFRYGCHWESNETWATREEAVAIMQRWKESKADEWLKVVGVDESQNAKLTDLLKGNNEHT